MVVIALIAAISAIFLLAANKVLQQEKLRIATTEAAALCMELAKKNDCSLLPQIMTRGVGVDPWGQVYQCGKTSDGRVSVRSFGREVPSEGRQGFAIECTYKRSPSGDGFCSCPTKLRVGQL